MTKFFLDLGFAFTKSINSKDNKRVLRPSLYSQLPVDVSNTAIGIYSDFGNYYFGDSAADGSTMPQSFQGFDDCLSNAYAANVLMCIAEMSGKLNLDCELVLSLPFEAWRVYRHGLMHRLAGKHKVKRIGYREQTISINFHPKWGVMPQNVAPVFAVLDPRQINRKGVVWFAVGNAGGYTFEQGAFGIDFDDFGLVPGTEAQQDSVPRGMYTLANDLRRLLTDHLRGKRAGFEQHELFEILKTGKVEYGSEYIDVSEIIKPKKLEYLQAIHNANEQRWNEQTGREITRFYMYYQSGGGAGMVAPYLREVNFHPNIVTSDDPQFDVCYGSKAWHELIGE